MSLGRTNFDDINETDLRSLYDTGVPEGTAIEYKRDLYGNSDADVKEFLKDISSLANAQGGHLIIGLDERDGIAVLLTLSDVAGARTISPRGGVLDPPPLTVPPVLELPDVLIEAYGPKAEYHKAIRPAFDALSNAGGFERSQHFNEDGEWVGAQ